MRRLPFALLFVASITSAQSPDVSKEFQAGVDAFRLGKYDEAREHLEKARDLDPKLPGPYRFLAAVGHGQKNWDACIENARKALELNPRSSETADTRKLYDECRISAGRPTFAGDLSDSAAISVTTNVSGASVKINGLVYGATPVSPRPITAGELEIEISKQGWKPVTIKINALPGIVTDITQDLEPDPAAQAELKEPVPASPTVGWLIVSGTSARPDLVLLVDGKPAQPGTRIELPSGTHSIEAQAHGTDGWHRRVRIAAGQKTQLEPMFVDTATRTAAERRGFYFIGAGGALLLGGFITAMVSRDGAAEARDIVRIETARDPSQPLSVTGQIAPVRTRADLHDARDRASRFAIISDVSYATGLVAAGVGAYYLYRGARERTDAPPPFAIAPTRGGLFVAKELAW